MNFALDEVAEYDWPIHAFQLKFASPEVVKFTDPDPSRGLNDYTVLRMGVLTWPVQFRDDSLKINREWLVFDDTWAGGERLVTAASFFGTEQGRVGPPMTRPPFTKAHPLFVDAEAFRFRIRMRLVYNAAKLSEIHSEQSWRRG